MVDISAQQKGTHPNGKAIFVYTLQNQLGTIVQITNYGAIIMAIKIKKSENNYNDIVLGFDEPSQYWSPQYLTNYPYYGAAIGRYGNRIDQAAISIDGQGYALNSQQPGFQLHGGIEGFDKKIWEQVPAATDELALQYISPDGEEGYPGALTVQIIFKLNEQNELSYEYKATTSKATAVNLTHHSYFNLNNGTGDVHGHQLRVNASQYLEQDANYCTTGSMLPVAGTRNDFRSFRQTRSLENPEEGIDISFPLDTTGLDQLAAEAYLDGQEIAIQVFTTEPVVHLYNARWSPEITGKNGTPYAPFSGFCFETQKHPNAIRIESFPNTILRPDEQYYSKTVYRFVSNPAA